MMMPTQEHLDKSRLGRLFVHRGYITDEQLASALEEQRHTGERLGVVLMRAGLISRHQLDHTLKHQSHYRCAAALAAMALLPLQPVLSLASPSLPLNEPVTSSLEVEGPTGMAALTDVQMSEVTGQGSGEVAHFVESQGLPIETSSATTENEFSTFDFATSIFFPISHFLESDVEVNGIEYGPDGPAPHINPDGSINLAIPERIESIHLENIRLEGSPNSASMGSLTFSDLELSNDSTVTVRMRP